MKMSEKHVKNMFSRPENLPHKIWKKKEIEI